MTGSTATSGLSLAEQAGIGQLLREGRTQKGMTVADSARQLHLQLRQVEALERGDFTDFNGPAFVKGYLRACARLYALDGDALVSRYEATAPQQKMPAPLPPVLATRIVRTSGRAPVPRLLMTVLPTCVLLVAVGVGLWWSGAVKQLLPEKIADTEEANVVAAEAETQAVSELVGQAIPSAVPEFAVPVSLDEQSAAPPPPLSQTILTAEAPPVAPVSASEAIGDDPVLHVEFMEECWLQVKDDGGKVLHDRTHKRGEVLDLAAKTPLHLWFGKATAVNVSYNGAVVTVPVKPGFQSARFVLGDDMSSGGTE